VSQPTAPAGTVITAPTNVTVQLGGNPSAEERLVVEQWMKDFLDRKAADVKAALVTAVPK
jgi:hypothetical protein